MKYIMKVRVIGVSDNHISACMAERIIGNERQDDKLVEQKLTRVRTRCAC